MSTNLDILRTWKLANAPNSGPASVVEASHEPSSFNTTAAHHPFAIPARADDRTHSHEDTSNHTSRTPRSLRDQ
jgi:hypothetical protein